MAYQALYRKYRPDCFEDVIGQEHITQTLKNEILSGKIAHAYLFTGIRGTGKTTTAKILSRAVNCLNNNNGDPCNECEICKGIISGAILDVIEIDAASNNGVDSIRAIKEEVVYTAASTKYKVYIIDEVHMLSQGAFNALLKTLEEPPSHVIFILATTESHKIPATILSRCQRFDFRRITADDVAKRLKKVALSENVSLEDGVYALIAGLSEGSMRDALSILDRCLAFGTDLTVEQINFILGLANNDLTDNLALAVSKGDTSGAMQILDNALFSGKSAARILESVIKLFRDILVCRIMTDPKAAFDYSENRVLEIKALSENFSNQSLVNYINILSSALNEMKFSQNQRIYLEVAIIKLCMPDYNADYDSLISRLSMLEEKIEKGVNVHFPEEKKTDLTKPKAETPSVEAVKEPFKKAEPVIAHAKEYPIKENSKKNEPEKKEKAASSLDGKTIAAAMQAIKSAKSSLHGILTLIEFSLKDDFLILTPGDEEGFGMGTVITKAENESIIISAFDSCNVKIRGIKYIENLEPEAELSDDLIKIINE